MARHSGIVARHRLMARLLGAYSVGKEELAVAQEVGNLCRSLTPAVDLHGGEAERKLRAWCFPGEKQTCRVGIAVLLHEAVDGFKHIVMIWERQGGLGLFRVHKDANIVKNDYYDALFH